MARKAHHRKALFLAAPAACAALIATGCNTTTEEIDDEPPQPAPVASPLPTQEEADARADEVIHEGNAEQIYRELRSSIEADLAVMDE